MRRKVGELEQAEPPLAAAAEAVEPKSKSGPSGVRKSGKGAPGPTEEPALQVPALVIVLRGVVGRGKARGMHRAAMPACLLSYNAHSAVASARRRQSGRTAGRLAGRQI